MCGIAGIYNFKGDRVDPRTLVTMTTLQHHRGPDDYGYVFFDSAGRTIWSGRDLSRLRESGTVALGHRRLTIIDLQETGRQPMSAGEERYWIVYNGEIYNYIELREELKILGHIFRGTSDTEVILHAYQQWNTACVERFNGMWAFAIWDTREQILFASRDRVGIKPFYYYLDDNRFVFASEIKAVFAALPGQQRTINEPYLGRFIHTGLLNDADHTLFQHVRQLVPGHNLEIKKGHIRRYRYWDIPQSSFDSADKGYADEKEAVECFRELLTDAIRLRFRADVPVGTCLSGGLDSSSIVALATRALSARLSTFTTEYNEKEFSEGRYARAAAETFQTNAHYITPTGDQYIDFIDRFSWYHDEPCPGPGPFSQWHVMELASHHVKVVLDGQGADELLGGYPHYYNYYLTSVLARAFTTGPGGTTLSRYFADKKAIARHMRQPAWRSNLEALAHIANRSIPTPIRDMIRPLRKQAQRIFFGKGPMYDLANKQILDQALPIYQSRNKKFRDDLNDILYWELIRDNIPMLMQYGDRTSMAFSIESRVPFLDYRLLEYVNSLPYNLKIKGSTTKYVMRQAMRELLPPAITDRPDKKGYPTPFALWLKGPIRDYVQDMLNSSAFKTRNIFRPDKVQILFNQHCTDKFDHAWLLWRVVNLERWFRTFFDDFQANSNRHLTGKV
ncbi:MAG: asparagine synthase (glutamine-hydrolyzing) [Sedimentisphaerales bacterium]|nr:asparagine synthase (glutamine-hydrolyzing) [Sedimentisphaerales bacterium]